MTTHGQDDYNHKDSRNSNIITLTRPADVPGTTFIAPSTNGGFSRARQTTGRITGTVLGVNVPWPGLRIRNDR